MTQQRGNDKRAAVDAALSSWRQGDCVLGEQWFVHRATLEMPLTPEAEAAVQAGVDLAESEVLGLAVVSQTCDIVRACADRPFVEVAPLVEVAGAELRSIERGRRPRYAFIAGLEACGLVADLDRVMTVEKAVVATWRRTPGCSTDQQSRSFALALTRKRSRFAFPDDFSRFASKLQDKLQEKHDRHSDEGGALRSLREIRVRAAPSWDADSVSLMFWFIRSEEATSFDGQSWDKLLEKWMSYLPPTGRFGAVHGGVQTLDDLTARDYVESDPLDLDHLSARPA